MPKIFNKTVIYLTLIVLLAGGLRIARAVEEDRYSVDAYFYFEMAENWACYGVDYTQSYNANNIPPLLPLLMAMGYNLGLNPDSSGLIIGILLGSLMPLAAFWIALNLFFNHQQKDESLWNNNTYALLAAFLIAIHPFLVRISVSCLREILYLPLIAFAIAFAVSAIYNKSLWKWGGFAVLTALASMTRREGIIIIFIFLIWQLGVLAVARKNFTKNIKYNALSIVVVMLIFSGLMFSVLYLLRDSSSVWSPFFMPVK